MSTEGPQEQPGSVEVDAPSTPDADDLAVAEAEERDGARRARRSWPGVVLRAVVVLAVAGVGYYEVIPSTHVQRSRLSQLLITVNGTTTYPGGPSTSAERPSTTGGLASMKAAAAKSPNRTGIYVSTWTTKASAQDGLAMVAFLTPDTATAGKVRAELAKTQLSANAYSSSTSPLTRTSTFSPAGIPGAAGSLYSTGPKVNPAGHVAVTVWQTGRVVALVESVTTGATAQSDAVTSAQREAARLSAVEPGFTLSVTRYPSTATIVWSVGSLIVLILVAGGPVAWRRRQERKARELEEELARTIRVRGQTIVRRRREV